MLRKSDQIEQETLENENFKMLPKSLPMKNKMRSYLETDVDAQGTHWSFYISIQKIPENHQKKLNETIASVK